MKLGVEYTMIMLVPVWDQGFLAFAKSEAQDKLVAIKIAAWEYREKHHELPTSLDQLFTPEQRTQLKDPFDPSRELSMIRNGEDMVFCSVGPDGVDDQGKLIAGVLETESKGDFGLTLNANHRGW